MGNQRDGLDWNIDVSGASPAGERIARLETKVDTLMETVDHLAAEVASCRETIAQANGGLRVLMWIGGLVSVTGLASLAHFLGFLPTSPPKYPTH